MIALHAWLSSGSSRCAYLDLDHTRAAFSAIEQHNANAVVLIVLSVVPHLEFANFLMRLLCVATFIFVLCMFSL